MTSGYRGISLFIGACIHTHIHIDRYRIKKIKFVTICSVRYFLQGIKQMVIILCEEEFLKLYEEKK